MLAYLRQMHVLEDRMTFVRRLFRAYRRERRPLDDPFRRHRMRRCF